MLTKQEWKVTSLYGEEPGTLVVYLQNILFVYVPLDSLPPPPSLTHIVTNIIYLSILTALSGVVTLVQLFFQISLATSYKDELNIGCEFICNSGSPHEPSRTDRSLCMVK